MAIEETGANILYLVFGFLEWFESPDSDTPRLAPLLLVPVRLTKGRLNRQKNTYEYTITYSGEDILPNLSLREKLRIDFGLALPELDDTTKPEQYFSQVHQIVEHNQPRWRARRYATVALLNFSKLLMYLDLDPKRWPREKPITAHPIISRFFELTQALDCVDVSFDDEHNIDELPEIHERYPLIEDADSSQHSALVDVINGEDLVIEGPPGTGKSQTITNLIAAALAQGKRVLFVAEKLAALEVVKRRLDNTGLGDFCLELHSHKTQKRKVLDDIESRLKKQSSYRHPAEIDADLARFEACKRELREHAERINSPWKTTGKTIHQILAIATRYRQQLDLNPMELHPEGINGAVFDPVRQRQNRERICSYGQVYIAISAQLPESGDLASHPWHGVSNPELQFFDTERVCSTLGSWQEALQGLDSCCGETQILFDQSGEVEVPNTLAGLKQLAEDLMHLSRLHGDERLNALPWLQGENLKEFRAHLERFREIQGLYERLEKSVTIKLLEDLSLLDRLKTGSEGLRKLGISPEANLNSVARLLHRIDNVECQLREIGGPIAQIAPYMGSTFQTAMALHEQGLRELREFIKRTIALKPSLWKLRHERFDDEELDEALLHLHSRSATLWEWRASLADTFEVERLPAATELEEIQTALADTGWLRWLRRDRWTARRQLFSIASKPRRNLRVLLPELKKLVNYAKEKEAFDGNQRFQRLLGEHFCSLETAIDDLLEIRSWYQEIRQYYGIGFGPKVALGQTLIDMPVEVAKGIYSLANQGFLKRVDGALEELAWLRAAFPCFEPLRRGNILLLGEQGILPFLRKYLTLSLASCQEHVLNPGLSLNELNTLLRDLIRLRDLVAQWTASDIDRNWFGGALGLSITPGRNNEEALAAAEHTESLASIIDQGIQTATLKTAIYDQPEKERLAVLTNFGQRLQEAWAKQRARLEAFSQLTALDLPAWLQQSRDDIGELIDRNERALQNREWLANWLDYVRVRQAVVDTGFRRLVYAVEQGLIAPDDVEAGYYLAVYDLLSREILRELPQLAEFSGNAHETIQQQFRDYDEKLKQLQRERVAWQIAQNKVPGGNAGGKVSEFTELALLRRECSKKKRHIPIRQLVRRSGNALAALKPCFMMGPMSVAQYLPPGELEFDLVVMDEASQMKPEDALGAIARGRQLVVVGDPKQLPPTNFFQQLIDDGEADPTALEESESILDAVLPLFRVRRLRWHYRSQHESLIAFSSQFFYDGKLILFPSPHSDSGEYGVKFARVHRGRFVNRRNTEEARVIAEAVSKHLLERPGESLGVVAMSAEQRDQIERELEIQAKENEQIQGALEGEQGKIEPLFIKNLENVQGDERDVIFISMTYGPQEVRAPVMQRFGPINSDVGWRRLNVLFTRARKRMHVFSSMGSEDIVPSASSKRGVRALRDFLAYAETGILHQTGQLANREPDSDFEIAVAEALRSVGFECDYQVGVAGFFIDIAVRDPGNLGRFLMGIECDGASYHSAKSVRDRDKLRQAILERLGWRIRRIWSTDWYKNPQAQLQPIIRKLNALKTAAPITCAVEPEAKEIEVIVEKLEGEETRLGKLFTKLEIV